MSDLMCAEGKCRSELLCDEGKCRSECRVEFAVHNSLLLMVGAVQVAGNAVQFQG
jgi:hypothetical protein